MEKYEDSEINYAELLDELCQFDFSGMKPEELTLIYGNLELVLSNLKEEEKKPKIVSFIEAFKFYKHIICDQAIKLGIEFGHDVIDTYELDEYNIDSFTNMVVFSDICYLVNLMFTLEGMAKETDKYDAALEIIYMEFVSRATESGATC